MNYVNLNRRSFIKKTWLALGGLAIIQTVIIIGDFLFPQKKTKSTDSSDVFIAGKTNEFKRNTVTPFRRNKFFLSRLSDGSFLALSIYCSHMGCILIWNSNEKQFNCPCHSSSFNKKGQVLKSPATQALSVHPIEIENDLVKVNTSVLVKQPLAEFPENHFKTKTTTA